MPDWKRERLFARNREVEQQIEDVRDGRSTSIALRRFVSGYTSTEVPDELRDLIGIRTLDLRDTMVSALPSWLSELPDLEVIDIRRTLVTEVPLLPKVRWAIDAEAIPSFEDGLDPSRIFAVTVSGDTSESAIRQVFSLGRSGALRLSDLSISNPLIGEKAEDLEESWSSLDIFRSELDGFLESQRGLRILTLMGLPIRRVPETIRELRALVQLTLSNVWPQVIPDWIFKAPDLQSLDLSFNDLNSLPNSLSEARRLRSLSLQCNRLSCIPVGVWDLAALEFLNVGDCPIAEIPPDILRLKRLKSMNVLTTVGSGPRLPPELVVPPPEIVAQGLDAIKRYWSQERDVGVDYLAEAKLLIVGESGAGKTSLAKKILDPGYALDTAEDSTEGISVMRWQFPVGIRVHGQSGEQLLQRDFRVNIWDFGGQEIYHSTHQFFLTKRSVYVLVTDERKEDTDFEYWLEVVNLLSDGSPLVIVQNRKQGRQKRIDLGALRQRYPNLSVALALDLADNSGLYVAVQRIRQELEQLPHIGTALPKTWQAVRLALEADSRNYIGAAEFFETCQKNGFTDRDDMRQLGGYLHDLGICLFFQDDALLSKTVILKPDWGTTAVYRVLDDPETIQALGEFTKADLRRIWSEDSYEPMRNELLQLMVKFQLCFQVPGSDTYVAPQLLTPSQPVYPWDEADNLVLRYEYEAMPKGIVRRLIVALHYQIASGDLLWRNGAVFEYEGSRAEVIEMYRRRLLTIRISGGDPRVVLGLIDHELDTIHRSYPGIKFKKFMPCDCPKCSVASEPSMFEIGELEDFARTGDRIQCRVSRQLRDPVDLLTLLARRYWPASWLAAERPQMITRSEPIQPEIFVSYKWGSEGEALVDEMQRQMAEREVPIIRDKSEIRYRDSIEQFMRRMGAGKAVVVILSKAYLESKYCMFELTQIAGRPEFAKRVYPIVMPDAGISDALTRVRYIRYWEGKRAELEEAMSEVGPEHLEGIREELDLFVDIRNMVARITNVLADMNTLTPEMHRGSDFEQLYAQLATATGA